MSLSARRHSFNGSTTPRIRIPSVDTKDPTQFDCSPSSSPTTAYVHSSPLSSGSNTPEVQTEVSSPRGFQLTPPTSLPGSLSPELQPITPPVITGQHKGVLQIGKYLLLEEVDANVYKAVDIQCGQEKICKVFTQETYRAKIAAYCRLYENTSVVEITEIIHGNKNVYVFFNKHYGDLHSYVRNKRKLKEEEAMRLYAQIAKAVAQCHQSGVIIRDLKLRKFVFTDAERTKIQLEGLEDSHLLEDEDDDTLRDKQGCPAYVSPEILERAQMGYSGKASDQWSSGVMLYTMLIGRYPFHESEPNTLFKKIKLGKYTIPHHISPKAKCLIRNLVRRDASERLSADEVLLHPWLNSAPEDDMMPSSRDYSSDQIVPKCVNPFA